MSKNTKTVGGLVPSVSYDPLSAAKRESVERMRSALLSVALDDPTSVVTAIQQVTILRVHHQISRIVQYLDIMDKLEDKLYSCIDAELNMIDLSDSNFSSITKLLAIQEKLQKSIIESNKLLAPYLDMEQYPAFHSIEAATPVSAQILEIPSTQRNLLRENASAILSELQSLEPTFEE